MLWRAAVIIALQSGLRLLTGDLKGTVSRDFLLQVFFGINDTGGKFCHQFPLCCWHRWQICHRCQQYRRQICRRCQRWPNKIIKIFLIDDFFHLPPVSLIPVANLELRISPRIFEKIRNVLNGILWGWGKTDSWKEPEAKNLVTLSL